MNFEEEVIVAPPPTGQPAKKKRVIIIANGGSLVEFIQLQQQNELPSVIDGEVWAINTTGTFMRCDRVIHMDSLEKYKEVWGEAKYRQFATLKVPVYTSEVSEDIPTSVEYPLHQVVQELGLPYFNTTVAYAVGLAIYEKFDEIALFGCDFTYANHHIAESGRACVEFWLRYAIDRGIRVVGGLTSTLFDMDTKQQLYGYRKTYQELVAPSAPE